MLLACIYFHQLINLNQMRMIKHLNNTISLGEQENCISILIIKIYFLTFRFSNLWVDYDLIGNPVPDDCGALLEACETLCQMLQVLQNRIQIQEMLHPSTRGYHLGRLSFRTQFHLSSRATSKIFLFVNPVCKFTFG
jgi:hypothetical protein